MADYRVTVLHSMRETESHAERWNELWDRSDIALPTARVELLKNWLESFAPDQAFQALLVEEGDRLVAALPLVRQRWAKVVPAGVLPGNEWGGAGELLLDPAADAPRVLREIVRTLGQLSWPVYRFCYIRTGTSRWNKLREVASEEGLAVETRPSHEVIYIPTPDDWEEYRRSWSKDHRRKLSRRWRQLEEQGRLEYRRCVPESAAEVEQPLAEALRIEDSGWKGELGTSMIRTPGIAQYMRRFCELLSPRRELEFAFLELNGQAIAFEMLWNAKGILHSYKVGYDQRFEDFDPGHLLMNEILREMTATRRCRGYDCLGPSSVGVRRFRGELYPVGRLTIAPRRWLSQALFFAYRHCRRPTTRPVELLRGTDEPVTDHQPAALENCE